MEEFDRITIIEQALADMMLLIQKQSITPAGYQFFNSVNIVNVDDEAVATSYGEYPLVSIYLEEGEDILSGQANAYENQLNFMFRCSVDNDSPIGIPRFEINKKMNTILSDIKAVVSLDPTVGGVCDLITLVSSYRVYATDGNAMRAGDIEINATVIYSQSRSRPDLNVC